MYNLIENPISFNEICENIGDDPVLIDKVVNQMIETLTKGLNYQPLLESFDSIEKYLEEVKLADSNKFLIQEEINLLRVSLDCYLCDRYLTNCLRETHWEIYHYCDRISQLSGLHIIEELKLFNKLHQ